MHPNLRHMYNSILLRHSGRRTEFRHSAMTALRGAARTVIAEAATTPIRYRK